MSKKAEIAEILRDYSSWCPQTQGYIVHGAIEKLNQRETRSYRIGYICGGISGILLTLAGLYLVACLLMHKPIAPVLTPEQQMEDTLQVSALTENAQIK